MKELRGFDLNLLIVFEAVYATRNISQAARNLNLSQPTISNAIGRLRDLLDDPLFIRKGRGVQPTPKAQELIAPIEESLRQIRGAVREGDTFDPMISKRCFNLVIVDSLEALIVPSILRTLENHHSISLVSIPLNAATLVDDLNDGSLDLAVGPYLPGVPDMNCEPLALVDLVVISRKNHPDINGALDLRTFSALGHVALPKSLRSLSRIDEYLYHHKIQRHVAYSVPKMWSFPNIVNRTKYLAVLPRDFAMVAAQNFDLDVHDMPFEVPQQQIYLTWKKRHNDDPGHSWLRNQIFDAYAGAVEEYDLPSYLLPAGTET